MATTSATSSNSIDVASLVQQLMAIERQPITKLNAKTTDYQSKISALGLIKSNMASFQTAVQALSSLSTSSLLAFKATSSDSTVVSATASSTAAAGTYSLNVTQLAQSQNLVATGLASATTPISNGVATTVTFDLGTISGGVFDAATGKYGSTTLSAGTTNGSTNVTVASTANLAVGASITGAGIPVGATIVSITDATNFVISGAATASGTGVALTATKAATFTSGGTVIPPITIDATNNTLQGIRDAINAANMGVTATIINDGSATPNRLTLTSTATGVAQSIKITTAGGDGTIGTLLGNDPAATQNLQQTVAAQNANFTVNGIAITSANNTVTNAIQGVSLTLNKTTTTPTTLTVASDTAGVSTAVSNFVTAYNNLYSAMKNATDYKSKSALAGDSTLRSFMTNMRSIAGAAVTGGTLAQLYDAGVSFNATGTMAVDSAKLSSALGTSFKDVANLFNNATTGYATTFNNWTSTALALGGTIDTKTASYNTSITNITNQINTMEVRMASLQKQYTTTYSNLNVMLTNMGSTSTYLSQQLARL